MTRVVRGVVVAVELESMLIRFFVTTVGLAE